MQRLVWLSLLTILGGCAIEPAPYDEQALFGLTQTNLARVVAANEPISGSISVYEALARALKYNLDAGVETFQAALRQDETRLASAGMLPTFVANAGYNARNNDLSLAKLDIPTGIELPPTSVSTEHVYDNGDATVAWNILDFSLAYFRSRQSAEQVLIARESRRKVIQRIFEDTRVAYWRAVASERLAPRFARIAERARKAIRNIQLAKSSGAETPMTALTYERELLQILQVAERLQHELLVAKSQLAALMNIAPGTPFKLADKIEQPDPIVSHLALEDLFAEAVFNRPEIRDVAYRQRINEQEAIAAVLALLPGISVNGSFSFNDDHFMLHHDWAGWGATVAGNLFSVLQIPAKQRAVEAESDLLRQKALAVTAAVMTQVFISRIRQRNAAERLATAAEYRDAQSRLVELISAEKSVDLVGEQTLIREDMNLLVAEVQHDTALGGMQSANSNLMTALGYDLQGTHLDIDRDVKAIAADIRTNWSNRSTVSDRGRYLAELEAARQEAERQRMEAERLRKVEERRFADAAKKAAADTATERQAQAARLRQEVQVARAQAAHGQPRRPAGSKNPAQQQQPQRSFWEWIWPSDDPPRSGGLKDTPPANRSPSSGQSASKSSGIYSGTK